MADVNKTDSKLQDQKIRDNCIEHLRLAANITSARNKDHQREGSHHFSNFFVGCGFHKPHVPWIVPEEFFEVLPGPPAEE